MAEPTILKGWQIAVGMLVLVAWIAGDVLLLSALDPSALDCLPGDAGRSEKKLEAVVCSPGLADDGWLGPAALLWMWGPVVALWLWLRKR